MFEKKDYYEIVIKTLVDKLTVTEWQLARAEEENAKLREEVKRVKENKNA